MTPEQINKAIAEACGWKHEFNGDHEDPEWYWIPPNNPDGNGNPPNYYSDLNAVHEAEKVLKQDQIDLYRHHLADVQLRGIQSPASNYLFHATAPQRCEALLKTLGKWQAQKEKA